MQAWLNPFMAYLTIDIIRFVSYNINVGWHAGN